MYVFKSMKPEIMKKWWWNDTKDYISKWNCLQCTYSNAAHKVKCDMCLTPKPKSKAKTNKINHSSSNLATSSHHNHRNEKHVLSLRPMFRRQNNYQEQNGPVFPENISWNPKKPISKQTIFERWMIAQIERQCGQQPAICIKNQLFLTNLRRVRAPTTHHTIQQQIDSKTSALVHSGQLDAGDFTDDSEEEVLCLLLNMM